MFKKIKKSLREYNKYSIIARLCVVGEVIFECIIPLIMNALLLNIYKDSMKTIVIYGFILIALSLCALTFGILAGRYSSIAAAGLSRNLRRDLFVKINSFSFTNVDKFSTASLVTRLTTDVTNVQNSYLMYIRTFVRCPFMFIFSFVIASTISLKMAILFVVVIPILIGGLGLIIWKVLPTFKKLFKKYDNLNLSIQENIKGMRVVKSYVREDYEKEKFCDAATNLSNEFTRAERILALNNPVLQFCVYTCMLTIIIVGSYLVINTFQGFSPEGDYLWGELSTVNLSTLITYTFQILMSLMMLTMVFVMFIMSIESRRRIDEVLDEEIDLHNPENPIYDVKDGSVEFKDVSFKYSKEAHKFALADINLSIKSGQTVGIIGGTGSSKTTLVNLIGRLYDATVGEVLVGGVNVKEYDIKSLRENVSVVLQKNILFSGTIEENIRFGNTTATFDDVVHACKLAQADEFIQTFPDKYNTHIEQGGTNVSGGQKQRLCIARAILKQPKILILDDSTSAVDTKTDALIRHSLKTEIPNTTKFIIAQRISSISDADMIIVMDGGKINAIGTHDELLKSNEIYKEVYMSQNRGGNENA